MEKGGFLPKKLVNIFRKAKHRMRPIQRGISNISKGIVLVKVILIRKQAIL